MRSILTPKLLLAVALVGCGGLAVEAPATNPTAAGAEICDDGIDNDGDSYTDCLDLDCDAECNTAGGDDKDGDGFDAISAGGSDCNDDDETINPEAEEVCDGVDNDCDGDIDLDDEDLDPEDVPFWFVDDDGDGYGAPGPSQQSCDPVPGAADNDEDCNDDDADTNPGASEMVGDCRDNNCDGDLGEVCAEALYTVRTSDDVVRRLDLNTLVFTDIGPLGTAFDFGELAYDQQNGVMFMIDGRGAEGLHTVDLATGAATLVGVHGIQDLFGLAVDPNTGVIYGSGESPTGLYTLSRTTGAATFIGDPGVAADGLDWDSTRQRLVGLSAGNGDLNELDTATGAPTFLANGGNLNNNGLAYDPVRDLYWAIDWSGFLFSYDPNSGYARTEELSGLGSHDGLTLGP